MKFILGFFGLAVGFLTPIAGRAQEKAEPAKPVRLALVSTDKGDSIRNVLTLAEAKLSEVPAVQLLERQAVDRVLAEQKLSLSGVVATEQALTIGKLLSVNLFAVL